MSDKEVVEYARRVVMANLEQYIDENPRLIGDIAEIGMDESNKILGLHIKGLKAVLERALDVIKGGENNG